MKNVVDIFVGFRKNMPLLVCLCFVIYFSSHIVLGKYGYAQLSYLNPISVAKAVELESLKVQSKSLEERVTLLRPDTLSTDLLEEQIRFILGYNKNGEIALIAN